MSMSVFPVPAPRSVHAPALCETHANPVDPAAHSFGPAAADAILHYREWRVGRTYYGVNQFVEYVPGNLPIIITVPHGGYATGGLADRVGGVHEPDIHTQELARLLHSSFGAHLGRPDAQPHLVINRLRRGKLDMNRDEQQATMGHPLTRQAWRQFHAFTRRAKREIVRGRSITNPQWEAAGTDGTATTGAATSASAASSVYSRGVCVDLHGQSHDHRHQLGYVLNQADLSSMSDEALDTSADMIDKCSMRIAVDPVCAGEPSRAAAPSGSLAATDSRSLGSPRCHSPTRLSQLIRGRKSLGHLLEALGPHPCVPSPSSPHAGPDLVYFNAGYNTHVNGSSCVGARQRSKEMEAAEAEAEAEAAAAAGETTDCSVPAAAADPDPAFTSLFDSRLVGDCFLSIQAETAYEGQRDSEENMQRFANNFAQALCQFTDMHVLRLGERWPHKHAHAHTHALRTHADSDLPRSSNTKDDKQ